MYGKVGSLGVSAGVGAATLPYTGLNVVWLVVAGITAMAAGFGIWRMIPRTEQ